MDDVGCGSAVGDVALNDGAGLGLLAEDGDGVVGCYEGVQGVDLVGMLIELWV